MKKLMFTIIILSLTFLFFGCGQTREINDLAIFSGISAETSGTPRTWKVTGEVVNEYENDSEENQTKQIAGTGSTLAEAISHCSYGDGRESHWGHASAVVLGPELAKEGIEPLLRYFIDNYQYRISMDLLLWEEADPAAVWSLNSSASQVIAYDMSEMMVLARETSAAAPVKLYQAMETLETAGVELTVPIVAADEEENVVLSGAGIFRGDRLVGRLSREELLPLLLLQNRAEEAVISLPDGKGAARLQNCQTRLEFHTEEDPLALTVTLSGHLFFTEIPGGTAVFTGLSTENEADGLATAFEEAAAGQCRDLVSRVQKEVRSDVFGFGLALSKAQPYTWASLGPHWNQQSFPNMSITVLCRFEVSQ